MTYTYRFFRRGSGSHYDLRFPCDLDARKAAAETTDVMRVETERECRVVWRRNVDIRTANASLKYPDLRVVEWFGQKQESK